MFEIDNLEMSKVEYSFEKTAEGTYKFQTPYVYSNGDKQELYVSEGEKDPEDPDEKIVKISDGGYCLKQGFFKKPDRKICFGTVRISPDGAIHVEMPYAYFGKGVEILTRFISEIDEH